jgi:hypothetical protein
MDVIRSLAALMLASGLGGCWGSGVVYESPAAQYLHRSDAITLSAGNAKDVNAAIHVIDPWPRDVGNRRIRSNGERMVGAIQRYHRPAANRGQGPVNQGRDPSTIGIPASGASGTPAPSSNSSL